MNTFKVIETHIPSYSDSYYYENGDYDQGYIIIEVTISGVSQHFKIPAYEASSGDGPIYQFDKAIPVQKKEKTINIWE